MRKIVLREIAVDDLGRGVLRKKAVRKRLGDPAVRGFGSPGANVDYKYLFHMTRPPFLLIDECTYLDGAVSAFQAANESM
jgi:hypothetical protein